MLIETVTLLLILAVTLYIYLTWNYGYWRKQGIVEVEPILPGFGNLLPAVLQRRSAFMLHNDVYRKFRDQAVVGFYHLRQPALILRDPEVIQAVLVNNFSKFHDNLIKIDAKREPLSAVDPFFATGQKWKEHRTHMAPAFTNSKIKNIFPKMQELCGQLNQYIDKHLDNDFEPSSLSHLYTTDVVSSCAFGLVNNTATGEENIFMKYGKIMMEEGVSNGVGLFLFYFMPSLIKHAGVRFIPSKVQEFLEEMVYTIIAHREKNNVTQNDFLQMIIKNREKALSEAEPNDKAAIEQINIKMLGSALAFFMEGFETSSMVINYTLHELAMNPDCQKKLREELQGATKEGNSWEYETLIKLPYLDHVISEAMRKFPVAFSSMKTCTESTTLQIEGKSVHIKAGTHIVIPVSALHMDPKWYPIPEKYDPDRFSEENISNRHHYTYLPFGEGPRICVGMRFALAQVKAFLTNIILNYNILKSDRTPEKLTYNSLGNLIQFKERLWIRLKKCE